MTIGSVEMAVLNCPKCNSMMERIEIASPSLNTFSGAEVDRCLSCKGLWFDKGEDVALMTPEVARALDTVRTDRSVRYDSKIDPFCPRCQSLMKSIPFKGQPHIRYESCEKCGGAYFDAGEFRDASSRGVFEWVKAIFKRA